MSCRAVPQWLLVALQLRPVRMGRSGRTAPGVHLRPLPRPRTAAGHQARAWKQRNTKARIVMCTKCVPLPVLSRLDRWGTYAVNVLEGRRLSGMGSLT